MKVFVISGTESLGDPTIAALMEAGHEVTVLVNNDINSAWLIAQGVRPARASVLDRAALAMQFRRHDAVVNLTAARRASLSLTARTHWKQYLGICTDISACVHAAANDANIPLLIQESAVTIYRDKGSEWITEEDSIDPLAVARANHAIESGVMRFAKSGRIGVILRFGDLYGSGVKQCDQAFELAKRYGIAFMMGRADDFVSPIHIHDSAVAVVMALTAPTGVYNVVDDEPLTKAAYADEIAKAAGRIRWMRGPGRLASLLGDRKISHGGSLRVSNARMRSFTKWKPKYRSALVGLATIARTKSTRP